MRGSLWTRAPRQCSATSAKRPRQKHERIIRVVIVLTCVVFNLAARGASVESPLECMDFRSVVIIVRSRGTISHRRRDRREFAARVYGDKKHCRSRTERAATRASDTSTKCCTSATFLTRRSSSMWVGEPLPFHSASKHLGNRSSSALHFGSMSSLSFADSPAFVPKYNG